MNSLSIVLSHVCNESYRKWLKLTTNYKSIDNQVFVPLFMNEDEFEWKQQLISDDADTDSREFLEIPVSLSTNLYASLMNKVELISRQVGINTNKVQSDENDFNSLDDFRDDTISIL